MSPQWLLLICGLVVAFSRQVPDDADPSAEKDDLSGELTAFVGREDHDQTYQPVSRSVAKLVLENQALKERLTATKAAEAAAEAKLQEISNLGDNAQKAAKMTYQRTVRKLTGTLKKEKQLLKKESQAVQEVRNRYLAEHHNRRVAAHYAHKKQKELRQAVHEAAQMRDLLAKEQQSVAVTNEHLNVTERQLHDAQKDEVQLQGKVGELRLLLANVTKQLQSEAERRQHEQLDREIAQRNASSLMSDVNNRVRELHEAEDKLSSSRQEAASTASALRGLQAEVQASQARSEQLLTEQQAQRADYRTQIDHLQNLIDMKDKSLELVKKDLSSEEDAMNRTRLELAKAHADEVEQDNEHQKLLKAYAELQAAADANRTTLTSKLAADEHEVASTKAELAASEEALNQSQTALISAMDLTKDQELEQKKLRQSLGFLRKANAEQLHDSRAKLADANASLQDSQIALSERARQIEGLQSRLAVFNATTATLRQQNALLESENTKQEQLIKEEESLLQDARNQSSLEASQLAEAKEREAHVLQQVQAERSNSSGLQAKLTQMENQRHLEEARNDGLMTVATQQVKALQRQLAELKLAMQGAQRTLKLKDDELANASRALSAANRLSEAHRIDANNLLSRVQQSKEGEKALVTQRDELKGQLATAQQQIATLNKTHAALSEQLSIALSHLREVESTKMQEVEGMRAAMSTLDEKLQEAQADLDGHTESLKDTRSRLEAARHQMNLADSVHMQLTNANQTLNDLLKAVKSSEAELVRTKAELAATSSKVAEVTSLQQQLSSAEADLKVVRKEWGAKVDELKKVRAQLSDATKESNQLSGERAKLTQKLYRANKQLGLVRSEFNAEDSELNFTKKDLQATMRSVSDLSDMRQKLAHAGQELKAYQSALSAKTDELNATAGELSAAKTLRTTSKRAAAAELKELETMKAKLRIEDAQLLTLHSTIKQKELAVQQVKRQLEFKSELVQSTQTRVASLQAKERAAQIRTAELTRDVAQAKVMLSRDQQLLQDARALMRRRPHSFLASRFA